MIFVTVGSMFPFDRLIEAVDQMAGKRLISAPVVAQIGAGEYEPKHIEFFRFMSKPDFERRLTESTMLLAHAGAGTIALAQAHHKPLLVVPRRKEHNEHVNDHQIATARRFEELGHVLVAYDLADIPRKLGELEHFLPRSRQVDSVNLAQAHHKPLLVVPRRKEHNEHVNDHQIATARRFEELGHVLVAYDLADIPRKLGELEHFLPRSRQVDSVNLAHRIADFLRDVQR